jgi:hypothetical protein
MNQCENMLASSSTVKTAVNAALRLSSSCFVGVSDPSALTRLSTCSCASTTDVQKFCRRPALSRVNRPGSQLFCHFHPYLTPC